MPEIRFGPYSLVKRLAVGGMAEVFLARPDPPSVDELVVVKQILPQLAEEPELLQLFFDEARISSRIFHPGIVRILDVGEHAGVHFLAMEYVDGLDLSQLMRWARERGEPLPLQVILRVAIDLCRALHFAHEATDTDGSPLEVVHRDVSPQNVLISQKGEVKLGDFGIARAKIRARRTATGVLRGKIAYVSPEQYLGDRGDRRVDIYAVGVVLYELIAGRRPFMGEEATVIQEVMSRDAPPLHEVLPEADRRLSLVLERALARNPAERFPTALALAAAMEGLGVAGSSADLGRVVRRALGGRERPRSGGAPPVVATITLAEAEPEAPRTETLPGLAPSDERPTALGAAVPAEEFHDEPPTTLARGPGSLRRLRWPWLALLGLALGAGLLFARGSGEESVARPRAAQGQLGEGGDAPPRRGPGTAQLETTTISLPAGDVAEILVGEGEALGPEADPLEPREKKRDRRRRLIRRPTTKVTRAKVEEAPRETALDRGQGQGELALDSEPWSYVFLGARSLGATPLARVALPAGRHVLRLENPERGLSRTIVLSVRADEQLAIKVLLADGRVLRR